MVDGTDSQDFLLARSELSSQIPALIRRNISFATASAAAISTAAAKRGGP